MPMTMAYPSTGDLGIIYVLHITQLPCVPSALQPGGDEAEIYKDQARVVQGVGAVLGWVLTWKQ